MLTRLFKRKAADAAEAAEDRNAVLKADQLIEQGHALEDQGHLEAALAVYEDAVSVAANYARAHLNLGHVLRELRRWEQSERANRRAVACEPENAGARLNLGLLLINLGKLREAEDHLTVAFRLDPTRVEVPIVLADVYERLQRPDEAEAQYRIAIAIDPHHSGALRNFGMLCLRHQRFDQASDLLARARAIDPEANDMESSVLFSLNFDDVDSRTVADRHRAIGSLIASASPPRFTRWRNTAEPERKLKVAYVSGDFLVHPVGLFLQPVLQHHDFRKVETYCYSNYERPNPIAASLRKSSAHWRDISSMSDAQVIELIRDDAIDILVDLSGHTNRNRLQVFASHPAPVQITWLGYLNTTGLEAMDYRICDRHTDPPGEVEALYTEKLIRMPDSQWCYVPWYRAEQVPHPPAARADFVVFGSFNQVAKISDSSFAAWARILKAVPDSKLIVLDVDQPAARYRLQQLALLNDVASDRIELRRRESLASYYSAVGKCDIALDTFPYNGATTTLDALWMGVPIIALRGERSISRSGYSILKTLDAEDLIADSIDRYVELNVRLAADPVWRSDFRSTLRKRLESSALMDAPKFVTALEQRFRTVWSTWCNSQGT